METMGPNDYRHMSNEPNASLNEVDQLATEIASFHNNQPYYKWYCKHIYTYGIKQVKDIFEQSKKGNHPGKLYATLIKKAVPMNIQLDRNVPIPYKQFPQSNLVEDIEIEEKDITLLDLPELENELMKEITKNMPKDPFKNS